VLLFLLSRRSLALFWTPAGARARALGLAASHQRSGSPKQGPSLINTLSPASPGVVSCSRPPQGARGGRSQGRGWARGTTRGRARPPRGLFGGRGLGRGGGGVNRASRLYCYIVGVGASRSGEWRPTPNTPTPTGSGSVLKIQPAPPGMPFGVHIDVITSMANLEGFFLPPRYPRPPGAPPW
jgi:hypothetical protein